MAWLSLDLREGKLSLPEDNVVKLVKLVTIGGILISSPVQHVQWLASAVGQIISMTGYGAGYLPSHNSFLLCNQ